MRGKGRTSTQVASNRATADASTEREPRISEEGRREGGHVLEMQRRRLLLGYTEVLAEHGLEGASVDRICKRAGVSRRTFYDLFADRDACFLAAFECGVERIAAVIVPPYRAKGHWHVRLRAALTALLEFFDAEPALAHLCIVEALKAGPSVLGWRRSTLDMLGEAIDEGRREGRGTPPPPLTAEGVIGGVLSVIHARLLSQPDARVRWDSPSRELRDATGQRMSGRSEPLVGLVNPLMSMIVHPYLGPTAAVRELACAAPAPLPARQRYGTRRIEDPFKDLPIRFTFRTVRVLTVVGAKPGASNRAIGDAAGVADQGQISKLLRRLERSGLVSNSGEGHPKGEPNAWTLTERGEAIRDTIEPSTLTPAAAEAHRGAPA